MAYVWGEILRIVCHDFTREQQMLVDLSSFVGCGDIIRELRRQSTLASLLALALRLNVASIAAHYLVWRKLWQTALTMHGAFPSSTFYSKIGITLSAVD